MNENKKQKEYQQTLPPKLTAEEVILWLEGYRELTFEIWKQNPHLRERWEKLNKRPNLIQSPK